ncbi:MAG: hypothetical protein J2P59_12770, partial [Acidimicrobiales bacterium]|nr:hypothetical protein [Acidimicrobiales bacterium]
MSTSAPTRRPEVANGRLHPDALTGAGFATAGPEGEHAATGDQPPRALGHLAAAVPPTMAHPARDMVVIAEWAVPLFRIAIIAMTPLQLMRTGPIKFLVAALVAINAVMLYLGWRRRGPYSRGRPGIVFDLLFALLSMTLFVVLLPTRTYAQMLPNSPLPLANYLAPCAAALAVWTAPRPQAGHLRALHRLRDIVLVGTLLPLLAG